MTGDTAVTFRTTRGSVVVPAELFEDDREYELAVYFARNLPLACTTVVRRVQRDGSALVTWRKVAIVPA